MAAIVGSIRMFAGTKAPTGFVLCDGSLLSTTTYDLLFNVIGTTYGGDGSTNFAVPDLRGRIIVGPGLAKSGNPYQMGETGGAETVHIDPSCVPQHAHQLYASDMAANTQSPVNASYGTTPANVLLYPDASKPVAGDRYFSRDTLGPSGGSPVPEPHENMMPSLAINFIIAVEGVFPTQ